MAMAMAPADEESAAVAAKARASTSTTTTTTTSTTTTTTTATTATATLPSAIPAVLTLCAYLNPPDRLRLATLFRLRSIQIAAVVAHRAPRELDHASALGDVDLLAHLDAHAARTATRLRGTHAAVDTASARGHLAVLRWWRARGGVVLYSAAAVDAASANGHLRVLRWWRDEAGLEIRYSEKAFDAACRNADFPVLAWWAGCGLPIRCSHDLVDRLATDGRIEVLRWLVAAGVKLVGLSSNAPVDGHPRSPGVLSACTLRVTADGLRGATRNGHLAVLQWLHADVLRRDFPRSVRGVMDLASAADTNFNVALLDFWLRRLAPLGLDYTMAAIDGASARGDLAALRWWKRSGLVLKYSSAAVNAASAAGRIDVLRWWRRSALKLEYTTAAVDDASANGHVEVLQWWKKSGLFLSYTDAAVHGATAAGHVGVLRWWWESGLEIKFSLDAVRGWLENSSCTAEVVEWWKESGLLRTDDGIMMPSRKSCAAVERSQGLLLSKLSHISLKLM